LISTQVISRDDRKIYTLKSGNFGRTLRMQFAGVPRNIQRHASKHWGFVSAADSRWSLRNLRLTPALLCTVVGHCLRDLLIAWGAFPDTCVPPTMTLNNLGKRLGQAQTQWRIFEMFRMLRPAIIGAVKAARRWREAPAAPAPAPPAASVVLDFASPRIPDLELDEKHPNLNILLCE